MEAIPIFRAMKLSRPIPVKQLAAQINAQLIGDEELLIYGINEIHKVQPGDLTFADIPKYFQPALNSAATILLFSEATECPPGKAILVHPEPFEAYNSLMIKYMPHEPLSAMVHESAIVHPSAILEPNVTIGPKVRIGAYSYIQSNVYIGAHTQIGNRVRIQAGTVIGTDAFYFKRYPDHYKKWHSGGRVIIEDHVDVGANCTINRGVSGDTIIGEGSKLDCLVHVGHGVEIGKHCIIAGQVGIGGKSIIGNEVILYGQVGVAARIRIGDKAIVAAKSGVSKHLPGGQTYFGIPAEELRKHHKRQAILRRLAKG